MGDMHSIVEEYLLQLAVLGILFRIAQHGEFHSELQSSHITAGLELLLGCLPHQGIAVRFCQRLSALVLFALGGLLYIQLLHPNYRKSIDVGAIQKNLWQEKRIAVAVCAGRD